MDKQKKLTNVVKILCFGLAFALIFALLTPIFVDKTARTEICGYDSLETDSVDVLLLGPSRTVTGISPMVLWQEYGIASYNIAMGGQSIPISYYNLKSALETQSPQLVVMDIGYAFQSDILATQPARLRQWLAHSQPSLVKIEAITHLLPLEEWPDHILQLLYFHDRWDSLSKEDFTTLSAPLYGAGGSFTMGTLSDACIILPETEKAEATGSDTALEYLEKILVLCSRKGIEVLLVNLPSRAIGRTSNGDGLTRQREWNAFADYALEHGVEYVNCLHFLDEIGIHFSTDYYDWGHPNRLGQQKISLFLGGYLQEHYDLPDHRGESAYAQWDRDCLNYYQTLEENGMLLNSTDGISPPQINTVFYEETLSMPLVERIRYNRLCTGMENGSTFTVMVGEFEITAGSESQMSIFLFDDANKYCAAATKFTSGRGNEWTFTVPDDGNSYALVFRQSEEMAAEARYIMVVQENE